MINYGLTLPKEKIHSFRVEQVLEPLVTAINRVSTEDYTKPSEKIETLHSFNCVALSIAEQNPEIAQEFRLVTHEIQEVGIRFKTTTTVFLEKPMDKQTKMEFNKALHSLYAAILRL
ncbi:hypothetical protein Ciccas_007891 [Cichlidogyrus casuarinus]|uniref:Uncharacterized protein n=1 Tax=Cichlidogyrus casuarinus TaxID=1844966 RepID=A0ABD2Q5N2_9PLAT